MNFVYGASIRYDPNLPGDHYENILNNISSTQEECETFVYPYIKSSSCSTEIIIDQNTGEKTYESHGTSVAAVAGAPKDGSGTTGIAYNAPIVAIRIRNLHEQTIIKAIEVAISQQVDVISISMSGSERQITISPAIKQAVASAISKNIPVVISAGNGGVNTDPNINCGQPVNLDYNCGSPMFYSSVGEIIVGGSQSLGNTLNKNFLWEKSSFGSGVNLSASATEIPTDNFDPRYITGNEQSQSSYGGTSMSAPMVAATVGMMKKIALANGNNNTVSPCSASPSTLCKGLSPLQLKSIVTFSGTLGAQSPYSSGTSTRFLGAANGPNPLSSDHNQLGFASIRDLNVYNALIIAKNIHKYQVLTRLFNTHKYVTGTDSNDWANYYSMDQHPQDEIFGITGLSSGKKLNFRAYSDSIGQLAFGYQVYRNSSAINEYSGGVSGIINAMNNQVSPPTLLFPSNSWNKTYNYTY